MIGIHIDSTATKSSIRRRAAIASNMQVSSSKTNKGEKGVVIVNKGNNTAFVENSYDSPLKRKLTTTEINYSQGKLVNVKGVQ